MNMKKPLYLLLLFILSNTTQGQNGHDVESEANIQICLILDVSGSMQGLISQAQNELWKTLSFVETFKKKGEKTHIELGQDRLPDGAGAVLLVPWGSPEGRAVDYKCGIL